MAKDEKNKKIKKGKDLKKNNEPKSSFLKESKAELKKVIWPTPKKLANDTVTVIGIVLIVAIIVFILDFIFLALNENLIIRAEEKIKGNNTVIEQTVDSTTENTSDTDESSVEATDESETIDTESTEEDVTTENSEDVQSTETTENAENSAE